MSDRRIAVIAVHGVADQLPQETVCSIGNLLHNLQATGGAGYAPFDVEPLRLPVRPLDLSGAPVPDAYASGAKGPAATSYDTASRINRRSPARARASQDTAYEFMYGQLRAYRGGDPADTYQTTRLAGVRQGTDDRTVHVYEMYWADLSKLGSGVLRVFGELYQLIFHVGSLGVHAVNAASNLDGFDHPSWKVWAWCQRQASNTMAIWIAQLNVALVGLAAIGLLLGLAEHYVYPAATATAVLIVLGAGGLFAFHRAAPNAGKMSAYAAVGISVVGGLAWLALWRLGYERVLALELLALVGALFSWITIQYRRRRPGAGRHGALIGVAIASWLVVAIVRPATPSTVEGMIAAVLSAIELVYLALVAYWALFVGALLLAHFAGTVVKILSYRRSSPEQRDRIFRACWTARLTLAMPASFFLVVTLALWQLVNVAVARSIPSFQYPPQMLGAMFPKRFPAAMLSRDVISQLVRDAASEGFGIMLGLVVVATAIAVWAMLPVVLAEIAPPKAASPAYTTALGRWLTNGFAVMRHAGRLVYIGFAVILPVFTVLQTFGESISVASVVTANTFRWINAVLVTSAGTLLLVRGRLKSLALGLRSPLDVMLDVDNHLREHPTDGNPRARIVARYASLLRYVCQWRDPEGRPYDALVVIAHSQGTVITADLLRFLTLIRREASLECIGEQLPVHLFTMGCPLRQLYELRFPHLYKWTSDAVQAPKDLGLSAWVNAYRSGDYVGRDLGLALPAAGIAAPPAPQPTPDQWRDFCVGAGAHTHYWDRTAPEVAVELDRLISIA